MLAESKPCYGNNSGYKDMRPYEIGLFGKIDLSVFYK